MTEMPSLSSALRQLNSDNAIVGYSAGQPILAPELRRRINGWRTEFSERGMALIGVHLEDGVELAALLLALWQLEKTALLVPDTLSESVEFLRKYVDGLAGDFPDIQGIPRAMRSPACQDALSDDLEVGRAHTGLYLLTSGSTGKAQLVPLPLAQIEDEVALHDSLFGDRLTDATVMGTVSHHHLYGLIWRIFWPLLKGRPFEGVRHLFIEDVLPRFETYNSAVLVTSPSHLSRLPENADWDMAQGRCALVVSSTAPLAYDASLAAESWFGADVVEIYGSTESGGVAWRRQSCSRRWQALPGIRIAVRCDQTEDSSVGNVYFTGLGELMIDSPLKAGDDWYAMGDQVELTTQTSFQLHGRVDQIVKIEGKRVSLTAIETSLESHQWVDQAKALVVGQKRGRLSVVAVLSASGLATLDTQGRRAVSRRLRDDLSRSYEAPVLPKYWRFPDKLPRNSQGKVPQSRLEALFEPEASPVESTSYCPEVRHRQRIAENEAELAIVPGRELVYFDGHFPDMPVLPGVAQVQWVEEFARDLFGVKVPERSAFRGLRSLKFHHVIEPGALVSLSLKLKPEVGELAFRIFDDENLYASGALVYERSGTGA